MKFANLMGKRTDLAVAVSMLLILAIMLMPVPAFALDILLSLSVSVSIIIMLTSVLIRKPLDFSVFPSVLLMVTLFRLSLNIATTRIILLKGNEGADAAGQVVQSFGNFVVGGNYAVGFIVFLIIVVINFIVITKGSGRIAEVAARFTLDAMPGKQMAIDADLNAGLIDERSARRRREQVSQEADFYGAMDGASKFVRGDAIAGLIITGINIIGGLLIGIIQQGIPIAEAAKTYTVLTIGDGLVSQIPALLISTSAGIIVSRAGTDTDLGQEVTKQVFFSPKALSTASGVLFVLAVVPGLPHIPFLLISIVSGAVAYMLTTAKKEEKAEEPGEVIEQKHEPALETFLDVEPLSLEIGYGLIPLVEEPEGQLLGKIKAMRRQLAQEIGFIVPPIHIKDNLQLRPHEYSFLVKGMEIGKAETMVSKWLAVSSRAGASKLDGVPTTEPTFGLPAYWIDEKGIEKAQISGYTVVDPATVIATHLTEMIRRNGWELLTRTEVQKLLDNISKNYPKIVEELVPNTLPLGTVQRVLQGLLKERIPIRDIVTVLETLLDYGSQIKDPEILIEHARHALARTITKQFLVQGNTLPVFTLDPRFEKHFIQAAENGENIPPDVINRLIRGIEKVIGSESAKGIQPVIVCSSSIRRYFRRLIERFIPSLVVISNNEIAPSVKLYTMGMVSYEN